MIQQTIFPTRISQGLRTLAAVAGMALLVPGVAGAQARSSASFTLGGVAYKASTLALSKASLEFGHLAISADITRDDVEEARTAGAEDHYLIWAASLSGRLYSRAPGRGFFAEVGGGYGRPSLASTDASGLQSRVEGSLPFATYGGGVRIGRTSGGLFGELGLRNAVYLREQHLHTDATPPAGSRDEPLSERSWYFGKGKRSSQLYVGIGYSF